MAEGSVLVMTRGNARRAKGPVSAGQWGGAAHQPYPARLGHLLCGGPIQSVFLVYPKLGGDQTAAALAAEPEASGLRVDSMALAAGLADGWGLPRLPRAPVSASSRFCSVGLITSDAKSAGQRSAGNPHAPFEVAGVGDGPVLWYRAYPRPYSLCPLLVSVHTTSLSPKSLGTRMRKTNRLRRG